MACGDVLRRVIGAVFCRRYDMKRTYHFQPWGQYGVAVSGGVDIMALTSTLGFEEGCTDLSYDGADAFNSKYSHRFLLRNRPRGEYSKVQSGPSLLQCRLIPDTARVQG